MIIIIISVTLTGGNYECAPAENVSEVNEGFREQEAVQTGCSSGGSLITYREAERRREKMMSGYLWDSIWFTDFSPQSPNEASLSRLC